MIKLFAPYIPEGTLSAIGETFASGQVTQSKKVEEFEDLFKQIFKRQYSVSLNSGTAALELAYDLIGLKEGDEVISTPLTCTATNLPLLRRGVKIIWADVLKKSLTIDPIDVTSKTTEKTKAIVQVHLGGIKADVGTRHVPVVSDACQALGIFTGNYTCCSFQAIKHITTGDGGMLVLSNNLEYKMAKLLRWFGIDRERKTKPGDQEYLNRMMTCEPQYAGYKYHMNDIQATMGIVGLGYYGNVINHRKKLFEIYRNRLSKVPGIELVVDGKENTYWLATILADDRDGLAKMLKEVEVEVNVVQVRNDLFKIFGGRCADLPVLNQVENRYLSLPIGMHISEYDVNYVCDKIEGGW